MPDTTPIASLCCRTLDELRLELRRAIQRLRYHLDVICGCLRHVNCSVSESITGCVTASLSQYDSPAVDVMYHVLTRGVYDRHSISAGNSYDSCERQCAVGGVFGAYQAIFPPISDWQAEMVDQAFMNEAGRLATERGLVEHVRKWRYDEHSQHMNDSGLFRYVKEMWLHSTEQGNAERFVGLMLSQGLIQTLLKNGVTEAEIGLPAYRQAIQRLLGSKLQTWYFSFRVLIGIT